MKLGNESAVAFRPRELLSERARGHHVVLSMLCIVVAITAFLIAMA